MTTIHIFLGSSLDELRLDREEMGNYVRKLNDVYIDRGVYIKLYECEYENAAMVSGRKQEEYNEEIRQSDIFLVLFYNKAGQYTIEEFREAYKQFQSTGAPAILACFRQGEGYAPDQSVLEFMGELDEQLGHYFKRYTHIDSVKLTLLLQMKLMKLDIPIELEESAVTVGGKQLLTLENIPMWAENIDFQSLKKQYQACERAYLDAKAATTDPVTDPVFLRASEQWNEAKKALRALEQELFSIALKIEEKNNDGTLTERQRKAYELMEQGDAEGANNILDLREILDDVEDTETWKQQAHEKVDQQANKKLEQNVQELLQKIEILKTQVQNPDRFDQIKEIFEKAVGIEERNHLAKIAMWEYVLYLYNQNDYIRAIPLAERYLKYAELDGDKSDIVDAMNVLGLLYKDTNQLKLAKKNLLQAKEIYEQLAVENPSAYLPNLLINSNSLGRFYLQTNRMKLAMREFLRVKESCEQLATENPETYQPALAASCNALGVLYAQINHMDMAKQEFLQAKKIQEQLIMENPLVDQSDLAESCSNLGNLYVYTKCMDKAKQEYLRAKGIYEQLVVENPSAYQPALAESCNNLGNLYVYTKHIELAEQELLQAKKIRKQLASENPLAYQPAFAGSCNNLGILYARTNQLELAEQEYLQAKKIYKQLSEENPEVHQPYLALSCDNLGVVYARTDRLGLAEQEFLRAREIYKQFVRISPERYMPYLQMVRRHLKQLKNTREESGFFARLFSKFKK